MTPGTLTLVATPIGNLGDFSPRAAEVLSDADIIACEDTRVTRKLLNLTGTATSARMVAYHDHNGAAMRPWLLDQLADGKAVVLVSDAGTPLISDPGYKLVAACRFDGQVWPCIIQAESHRQVSRRCRIGRLSTLVNGEIRIRPKPHSRSGEMWCRAMNSRAALQIRRCCAGDGMPS